jgi:hypothetical protein
MTEDRARRSRYELRHVKENGDLNCDSKYTKSNIIITDSYSDTNLKYIKEILYKIHVISTQNLAILPPDPK